MRSLRGLVVVITAAMLVAAIVVALLGLEGGSRKTISPKLQVVEQEEGARAADPVSETCSSRSEGAFETPYRDPHNLVVGPLAFVGGADFTPPSVVRSVGGQKYPVLVRSGRSVTVRVPENARAFARLGYGPLPQGEVRLEDGHVAVTFRACPADEPAYSSDGTVGGFTFWSGFVLANASHCVPLDVYIDGARSPRRIVLELGIRPCWAATPA